MRQTAKSFLSLKEKLKTWFWRLKRFRDTTNHCLVCFEKINGWQIDDLFGENLLLCHSCFQKMGPRNHRFTCCGVNCLAIYPYNEAIKSMIFKLKGCGDVVMAKAFLNRQLTLFKLLFQDYVLVPAPSSKEDDIRRGFNHVEEIFKPLGLKIIKAIEKTKSYKQSSLKAKERRNSGKYLAWKDGFSIKGKKVLFVDDIYTTGSTARACIKLIKEHKPASIKALFIAKTIDR